jgi:hypothetical protein
LDAGPRRQRAAERLTELWNTRDGVPHGQIIAGVKIVNPFL